jgi:hypothetical protein
MSSNVRRREFVQSGSAGLVLLAVAGCAGSRSPAQPYDAGYEYAVLSPSQRGVIAAIASAMLVGALPNGSARASALVGTVRGVDVAVAGLPLGTQAEFRQLLQLLENPLTRWITTGVGSWDDAGDEHVTAFLNRWRFSRFTLLRSGYDALHQLIMAAWYARSEAWKAIGYAGPPRIS